MSIFGIYLNNGGKYLEKKKYNKNRCQNASDQVWLTCFYQSKFHEFYELAYANK